MAKDKTIVYEFYAEIKDVLNKFKEIEKISEDSFNKVGKDSKNASDKIKSAFKTLNIRPFQQIEADIKKVTMAYETLRKSGTLTSQELAVAQQAMQQKVKGLKEEMSGLTQQSGFLAQQMSFLKTTLATAAFTFFTKETFAQFGEFDKNIRNVWTLTDATEERMGQLGKELRAVAKDLPASASELARATYDIVSAGVSLEDASKVVELASKAAVAGITDTQTAAKVGVQIMNAYGKSTSDLGGIYENLFNLVKYGVTTFEEISQYIGQVVPIAKGAGIGLSELSSTLSLLTQQGLDLPRAVTGLRAAITSLVAPTAQTKKVMDAAGITWNGLTETLKQLKKEGFNTTEALGKLGIPRESMAGIQILINSVDELDKRNQKFAKSSGVFEEATKKQLEGFQNQYKILKSNMQDAAATIGGDLAVVVTPLIKGLTELIQKFNELPGSVRVAIELLVGFKGAVSAIMTAQSLLGLPKALGVAGASAKTFGESMAAAGMMTKLSFIAVAATTIYKLYELIKAIIEFKKEAKSAFQFSPDFGKEAEAYEKYKDFKVKTNDELKNLDETALKEYGDSLAKKRAYLNNTIAKLTKEEQSPFNILIGRDKSKEKEELENQLKDTESQMKSIIAKRRGVTAKIDVLLEPELQAKQQELELQELTKKRQEILEKEKQKQEEIQKLNANHLKSLLGIDMTEQEILEKIEKGKSTTEVRNDLINKAVKEGELDNANAATKAAIILRTDQLVQEIFDKNKEITDLEKTQLDLKNGKIEAIKESQAALESYKSTAEKTIAVERDVKSFDVLNEKIGIIVNSANEMYAMLEGKTVKIDVEDAFKASEKMAAMTEKQKVDFLNATGSVKIMGTSIQDTTNKIITMQESTKKMTEDVKTLSETPVMKTEGLTMAADAVGKSAEQIKTDMKSAIDAVQDLAEVQIVPEGFDVSEQEAKLQDMISAQTAQKEQLATEITEAQQKRAEIEAEIAALNTSFTTVQNDITQKMAQSVGQMALAMQQSFNLETISASFTTMQEFLNTMSVSINTLLTTVITNIQSLYANEKEAAQAYVTERAAMFQTAGDEIIGMADIFIQKIDEIYASAIQKSREAAAAITDVQQVAYAGSEETPGFATGGLVSGKPGRDKIHAMLTANEFVMNKSSVKKYGIGFFQALNKGLVNLKAPSFSASQLSVPMHNGNRGSIQKFSNGGLVNPVNNISNTNRTKIVNLIDPDLLISQMAGKKGEQVILNTIKSNSRLVRTLIS